MDNADAAYDQRASILKVTFDEYVRPVASSVPFSQHDDDDDDDDDDVLKDLEPDARTKMSHARSISSAQGIRARCGARV